MVDSKKFREWLSKSKSDLDAARLLYDYDHDLSLVAFHCQQAVEKSLKGFILALSGKLVSGHSLLTLVKVAESIDSDFAELKRDCSYLNQYYIETRYPPDIPFEITKSESEECLKIAESILTLIFKKLQMNLSTQPHPFLQKNE